MRKRTLLGRHVLLTGAAGGIGTELSKRLVSAGVAALHLVDKNAPALAALRATLEELAAAAPTGGGRERPAIRTEVADLSTPEGIAAVVAAREGAPLDLLVNNAGIAVPGPFRRMALADVERTVSTNLLSILRLTHALLPALCEREGACIVNVASAAGLTAPGGLSVYSATKYAIVGFSESLRIELARSGVGVVTICPSFVLTDLLRNSFRDGAAPSADEAARTSQLERLMKWAGISPAWLAARIIRAIERDEAVVVAGRSARALLWLKRELPWSGRRISAAIYERMTRQGFFER
jgi:short-subunit dehydrogenase